MTIVLNTSILEKNDIPFETNVSLKNKTWIHRGGIANYWIQPKTLDQLCVLVNYLNTEDMKFEIVGYSTNLYFQNDYSPEVVISTKSLKNFSDEENWIACECGCSMRLLSEYCVNKGYSGYEGLIDLPGTVGGAVYNNSSCYKCSVSDLLIKIDYLNNEGKIITLSPHNLQYKRRSSIFKRDIYNKWHGCILNVYLKKDLNTNPSDILNKAKQNHEHRKEFQEGPKQNLGSVFIEISYKFIPRLIVKLLRKLCFVLYVDKKRTDRIINRTLLIFFGGIGLRKYVSKKTLNCFLWLDENSDRAFVKYRRFMKRISQSLELEIEIKKGDNDSF
ncbi:MAG: FAD-binding protein [Clostridiaceae bacterium]|nr:FAD-binding protein [Clostridiaceae bacterium]